MANPSLLRKEPSGGGWSPRFDVREAVAIFAGAFAGAVLRGLLSRALTHNPSEWPWATFAVNIAGAALLAWGATRLAERLPPSAYRRPLLGTGFCGALTTFSAMQLELVRMVDAGSYALAFGYGAASVVMGLLAMHVVTGLSRRSRVLA